MNVLVLCTANQCRSPMAEVLLKRAFARRGAHALVASAGILPGGVPASPGSVRAMARRRLVLDAHRSHKVEGVDVEDAHLVLAMARSHAREAVVLHPEAWPRTFTLKELVRRGEAAPRRRPDEPLEDYLGRLGEGRQRGDLLSDHPDDDVADPMGGPDAGYEATAVLLEDLVERAADLLFTPAGRR